MSAEALEAADGRSESMIAAAVWLVEQGFCSVGWGPISDAKAVNRRWKSDATDDPALVPQLLHGARNALVIPAGRGIIIDVDEASVWDDLAKVGLPDTLRIKSPTPGHGHVYGFVPPDVDMRSVPGTFNGGEIRRSARDGASGSMVLGPWARTAAGVYEPMDGIRTIAELPATVLDWLRSSSRRQTDERRLASGPSDDGWFVTEGRHDYLVGAARTLRGHHLTGERLFDELARLDRERCRPSLADEPGRGEDELRSIVAWTMENIGDDQPLLRIVASRAEPDPPARVDVDGLIVGIDAYRASVPAEIPWRCRPIAYSGGVTLLAGPPKKGKSTLAAQLQRCCESGTPFLGTWPVAVGPVLLVTEEGGIAITHKTNGMHQLEVLDRRSVVMAGLSFDQVLELIAIWAAEHPAGLAFIDTLAIWAGIEDENDATQVTRAVAKVTALAQAAELAIVLVHHTRKSGGDNGDAIRGSGAILATVDIAVEHSMVRLGSDDRWLDVQGRIILPERFLLSFDRVTSEYSLEDQADARLAAIEDELAGVPDDGPGLTRNELRGLWGKDPRARVEQLVAIGRMRSAYVKSGRTWAVRHWSIPPVRTAPMEPSDD